MSLKLWTSDTRSQKLGHHQLYLVYSVYGSSKMVSCICCHRSSCDDFPSHCLWEGQSTHGNHIVVLVSLPGDGPGGNRKLLRNDIEKMSIGETLPSPLHPPHGVPIVMIESDTHTAETYLSLAYPLDGVPTIVVESKDQPCRRPHRVQPAGFKEAWNNLVNTSRRSQTMCSEGALRRALK